jgi:hypothetical protein
LDGLRVALFLILEEFFLNCLGSGNGRVDSDVVRFVYHLFDFAGHLHALGNHSGHGHLLSDGAGSIFNGGGAAAGVLSDDGNHVVATVDTGFWGSDYSNLF